jgi:hypothetical protein
VAWCLSVAAEDLGKREFQPLVSHFLRKARHLLESKARIVNKEYGAQSAILADVDALKIPLDEFLINANEILKERLRGGVLAKA